MLGFSYILRQSWQDLTSLSHVGFVVRAVLWSVFGVYALAGIGAWLLFGWWQPDYQGWLASATLGVLIALSLFMFWPFLAAIMALLVQEELIARLVSEHYRTSRRVGWGRSLAHGLRVLGAMVLSYVLFSPLIVVLFFVPFLSPLLFYAIGGYWLARGLFELALLHNVPMAELKQARRGHFGMFVLLGALFYLLATLSLVLAPLVTVVAAVVMTHYAYIADRPKKRGDEDLAMLPPVGGGNIQG